MGDTADVIKRRREAKGLSQSALGALMGEGQKRISRLETGEAEPSLSEAVRLSELLDVSLAELAGIAPRGLELSGEWWAGWQTWIAGEPRMFVHPVRATQDGVFLEMLGVRAGTLEEGAYEWRGELRVWDNEALMGWYVASEGAVRSKGSLYFSLHPHGRMMVGSWAGLAYGGLVVRGWAAMTRERPDAEALMAQLLTVDGQLESWPTID